MRFKFYITFSCDLSTKNMFEPSHNSTFGCLKELVHRTKPNSIHQIESNVTLRARWQIARVVGSVKRLGYHRGVYHLSSSAIRCGKHSLSIFDCITGIQVKNRFKDSPPLYAVGKSKTHAHTNLHAYAYTPSC